MTKMVDKNCKACGALITVRLADHKRGWGNYCDKACAAAYKCGQRPKDVNSYHAKFSQWASICLETGGENAEKAATIEQQIGRSVKVKKIKRRQPACVYDKETEDDWLREDFDPSWDAHKNC